MLEVLKSAATLKMLPRTGWLLVGVAQPESVAEHSFATVLLAMSMAAKVNLDPPAHGLAKPLDTGRVVQIAVVHDLAESVVTDLPHCATKVLGKETKRQAEAAVMTRLSREFASSEYLSLWQEYSELATPEGRLVHDADKLEMIHQALVYERAGNQNLGEFWHKYPWHYQVSEEMYAALVEARRAGEPRVPAS